LIWRFPFKDALAESSTTPVVVGDKLIVSSITLGTVALKLTTKDGKPAVEELWSNPKLTCYFSTPVAVGNELYLATGRLIPPASMTLNCVDAATGKERWKREKIGKYHTALLRTGDNKLLMHSDTGELTLIEPNPDAYRELCKAKICGETWAHPAISGGRVFVRDSKELICVPVGE
jgi:outer membrane protein assembly factor BamB